MHRVQSGRLEPTPIGWPTLVLRGVRRRCPQCATGHLFSRWVRMVERCPGCGMRFEREEGFFVGAYLINFAIVEIALFTVLMAIIFVLSQDADANLIVPIILCGVCALVLPLVSYPWSRTIWSAISLAMHPLELEEIVSARDELAARTASEAADP